MVDDTDNAADGDDANSEDEDKERIQLSGAQIAASSLAAVSAAVVCSFFGVAGTVIGTAITSIVATTGSALYGYWLRRTRKRLRRLHQAGAASPPLAEVIKTARQQGRDLLRQLPLRLIGLGTAAVFVFSLGIVTVIELGAGESLSALFGVSHSGSRGTSLGSLVDPHHHHHPKPSPTASPSSSPSTTPTASATITPTATSTPTPSTTPTPTLSPTIGLSTLLPTKTSTPAKKR